MILSPKNLKLIPDKKTGSPKISVFSMKKVPNRVKGSKYEGNRVFKIRNRKIDLA